MKDNIKLKVLIVEDDLSFALELSMLVEEFGYIALGPVDNAGAALEAIYSQQPDIILMDHEIKGPIKGIALGQKIKPLNIPVLYMTAFDNDANYTDAQQSNMVGYLVKPIGKRNLRSALALAIENTWFKKADALVSENKNDLQFLSNKCLFIKHNGTFNKLEINSIAFAMSNDNYCDLYTSDGKLIVARLTLSKLENMLPASEFMRIHRQYIVRLDKIDGINTSEGYIEIIQKRLPITREKRLQLVDILNVI